MDPAPPPARTGSLTLSEVYEAEAAWVCHTLRRLGVAGGTIEDAAHDVFIVVARRLEDYDRSRPIRGWLFGIALRVAMKQRRRVSPAAQGDADALVDPGSLPDEQVESKEVRQLVERAIRTLPVEQRAVLILHDIEGLAATDIAAATDTNVNTVYSRLRLARKAFSAAVTALREKRGTP